MSEPQGWLVEVWVDEAWHEAHGAWATLPANRDARRLPLTGLRTLVGRASQLRNSAPQVDLSEDLAVSRRQAELVFRPDGWFVRDLGSANGTYLRRHGQPQGRHLVHGEELIGDGDGDELFVGSFTRIVLRRAAA